jgi:hypothetical protein
MTTWYAQGVVAAPTRSDLSPDTPGYDNGGLFGPRFANLGGDPFIIAFSVTTPTPCNCSGSSGGINTTADTPPVLDAVLTINGVSFDLAPPATGVNHNIIYASWYGGDAPSIYFINTLTTPFGPPTFGEFIASSRLGVDGFNAYGTGVGFADLSANKFDFPTNMNLQVNSISPMPVPMPSLGAGWPGLILALALGLWLWRKRQITARPRADRLTACRA